MNKISIELDQTDFTGGNEVVGRVILILDEPIPVRGVRVHFEGYERAHWVRGFGRNSAPNWETRTLYDEERTLHGQPPLSPTEIVKDAIQGLLSSDKYEVLEAGEHTFPFSYSLPDGLPGDYESPRSSTIRYEISAYVDIPLRVDLKTSRRLTIYETYDRESLRAVREEASKTFMLDEDAPLEVSIDLGRDIFNPGEKGSCKVTLQNASSKTVKGLRLGLVQIEDLQAQELHEQDRFEMELATAEAPDAPGDEAKNVTMSFQIPSELYASIESSALVRVGYALVLHVDVAWGGDLDLELPIVLREQAGMPSGAKLEEQPT